MLHLRDGLGNLLHIRGFAALAAIRHGREIRAVGFQHELVQRRGGHGVSDVLAVLERDNAGEADERADVQHAAHPVGVLAKAMEHAAHFPGEWLELGERVFEGVALVDDAIQSGLGGDFELLLENVGLFLFQSRVFGLQSAVLTRLRLWAVDCGRWDFRRQAVIIQTNLADGNDFGMPAHFAQGGAEVGRC